MPKSNLAGNSVFNIIKTLVTYVFPLITFMYASRVFLADGLGRIDFSQAYTAYFTLLGMLGIEKYGIREIAGIRDNKEKMSHLAHEIMLLNCVSVLFAYVLFFSSVFFVPKLREYETLLYINSISIAFTAMGLNWLYMAMEDYRYITIRTCIVNVFALLALFVFVHDKSDIYIFVLIQTVAATGSNILNLIHSRKYIIYRNLGNYRPFRHLKSVLILFGMTLFIETFTHLDKTMLGFISGDSATGLYSSAHKVSGVITAVITAAIMVYMPRITHHLSLGEKEKTEEISVSAINLILLLSIPSAVGLYVLSSQMILIFSGKEFLAATVTAKILSARILMSSLNAFIVLCLFIPLGKEKNNLVSTGAAATLNLIFNSFFIPYLAQNGAALGTILAEAIELLINLIFLSRVMPLKPLFKDTWQYILAAAPIVPIYFVLNRFIGNYFILVLAVACVAAAAYFVILYLIRNPFLMNAIQKTRRKADR